MDPVIRDHLLLFNPWQADPPRFAEEVARRLPTPLVPRQVDLRGLHDPSRAKLVIGPRQAGKSTLVWSWLASRPGQEVLFLLAEELLVQQWARSPAQVVHDLQTDFPAVRTLFVEEAQNLEEAGLFVKGLVDAKRDINVLVTGSSAYDLAARTRESLAGRAVRRSLLPFSHRELCAFEPAPVPAVEAQRRAELVRRSLRFGSYPTVWFASDPREQLQELVEAFVIRDASDRFRIERTDAFRRLLQLAAGQTGQVLQLSEWASILGVSASTVGAWVSLLEEAWILRALPPFAGGKRREITGARRIHFYDLGVRNALLGAWNDDLARRPDRGALFEGWVFSEMTKILPRDWQLHYWRSKGGAEMDFVAVRGEDYVGVEVKAGSSRPISRSTRSFVDAYNPRAIIVVSGEQGTETSTVVDSTDVWVTPLSAFSARIHAIFEGSA